MVLYSHRICTLWAVTLLACFNSVIWLRYRANEVLHERKSPHYFLSFEHCLLHRQCGPGLQLSEHSPFKRPLRHKPCRSFYSRLQGYGIGYRIVRFLESVNIKTFLTRTMNLQQLPNLHGHSKDSNEMKITACIEPTMDPEKPQMQQTNKPNPNSSSKRCSSSEPPAVRKSSSFPGGSNRHSDKFFRRRCNSEPSSSTLFQSSDEKQLRVRRALCEASVKQLYDARKDHIDEIFENQWIVSDVLDDYD